MQALSEDEIATPMLYSALFSREPKLLFETVQIKTILG
jgi:hypothetical protein